MLVYGPSEQWMVTKLSTNYVRKRVEASCKVV